MTKKEKNGNLIHLTENPFYSNIEYIDRINRRKKKWHRAHTVQCIDACIKLQGSHAELNE